MKIKSKEEKQKFLTLNIETIGSYALVTYNYCIKPIWITKYANWDKDRDWFLEAPCELKRYEFKDNSDNAVMKYILELYEECRIEDIDKAFEGVKFRLRDGWLYEIYCPQVAPFLPEVLDDLTLVSEKYCLEWILNNYGPNI